MLIVTLGIRSVDQMIRKQRLSIKEGFPSIQEGRRGKTKSLLARAIEIGEPEIYPPRNLQMFFSWDGDAAHIKTPLDLCGSGGDGSFSLMLLQDTMRLMLLGDHVKQDYMVHDTKAKQQLCAGRQAAMEPSTFC